MQSALLGPESCTFLSPVRVLKDFFANRAQVLCLRRDSIGLFVLTKYWDARKERICGLRCIPESLKGRVWLVASSRSTPFSGPLFKRNSTSKAAHTNGEAARSVVVLGPRH